MSPVQHIAVRAAASAVLKIDDQKRPHPSATRTNMTSLIASAGVSRIMRFQRSVLTPP